jgi:lipid-A-disaccharide synthase
MTCDFVGHPVAAAPQATPEQAAALRAELAIAPVRPLLALLPGSRRGEVARLGPVFAEAVRRLRARMPELAVVLPAAPGIVDLLGAVLKPDDAGWPRVLDPRGLAAPAWEARKSAAFAASDLALAASGTVSLELAAAGTPMVIGYDASPMTAYLVKRMVRVDTATLVNLVTDTRAVPEFLFENCTPERILPALEVLLTNPEAVAAQRSAADRAMQLLGRGGEPPGLRAARSVLAAIRGWPA